MIRNMTQVQVFKHFMFITITQIQHEYLVIREWLLILLYDFIICFKQKKVNLPHRKYCGVRTERDFYILEYACISVL